MTKSEAKSLDRIKQEYLANRESAEEFFCLSPYDYDRLDESAKRLADRHLGYAEGIYQVLVMLGQAEDLPEINS